MSSLSLSPRVTARTFGSRFWTTMVIVAFHFFYLLMPGSMPGEEQRVDARA